MEEESIRNHYNAVNEKKDTIMSEERTENRS